MQFIWSEHIREIVIAALLSMVPMFEGRYALTIMLGMGMPWPVAFLIAVVCSSIPVPIILWLFRPVVDWMYTLPIPPLRKFAAWVEEHGEKKAAKMDKVGLWGLFLFVAIPLPGTGGWTGSLISVLFKMDKWKSLVCIVAGNFAACAIMTALSMGVLSFF